jgi:tRNA (mo5U34)-methyltransferase
MTFVDIELSAEQQQTLQATDPTKWFTKLEFRNTESPEHPKWSDPLRENHEQKERLVGDWIDAYAPGRSVLDAFCANGAFAFRAEHAGAAEVTGIDFDPGRVEIAGLIALWLSDDRLAFEPLDVYDVAVRFSTHNPFDVTLALGGLYHIADPAFVLDQLRRVTAGHLILQTSSILPGPVNRARFVVRQDRTALGLSSIRGGRGVWKTSVPCMRALLAHAGFQIVEERRPARRLRRHFPWWCALAKAV